MRKKIIAGNWKMHGNRQSVTELLTNLKAGMKSDDVIPKEIDFLARRSESERAEHTKESVSTRAELQQRQKVNCEGNKQMIVFPPFVFLDQTQKLLKNSAIQWGAQTLAPEKQGAYTGEISAEMLLEFGCRYVIVGHSERRTLYAETDEDVAKKFIAAESNGICPILCVGESVTQREMGQTKSVVSKQLIHVIEAAGDISIFKNAILAYEPLWAIGTGLTATPEQAQEVHAFLREIIAKYDVMLADKMPILYGGSVKSSNVQALFAMPDIDGGLIGGASLEAQEFLKIYESAK